MVLFLLWLEEKGTKLRGASCFSAGEKIGGNCRSTFLCWIEAEKVRYPPLRRTWIEVFKVAPWMDSILFYFFSFSLYPGSISVKFSRVNLAVPSIPGLELDKEKHTSIKSRGNLSFHSLVPEGSRGDTESWIVGGKHTKAGGSIWWMCEYVFMWFSWSFVVLYSYNCFGVFSVCLPKLEGGSISCSMCFSSQSCLHHVQKISFSSISVLK